MKAVLFQISLLICLSAQSAFAQNSKWAEKMAETIMKTYPDSMVVMRYTSIIEPGEIKKEEEKRPAKWNYEMGVVFMGFERLWRTTGDFRYYLYMKKIMDRFITEEGNIRTYKLEDYNLDNIPTGRQLLTLNQTRNEKKYKAAADLLHKQLSWQPRTKSGGYWHKLVYPTQMWLDGLYMAEPFKAAYAQMTGRNEDFDDVANQFILMEKVSRDEATGLLYHGWDESRLQRWANPQTGQSPEFWSRAMGWYIMGLVDVLDYFPKDHPKRKDLIEILNRLSASIIKYQDPASGVWWQVTDKGGKQGNYLESSGSSMFVYGLAKAIRMGYLDESYLPAVKKAGVGLIKNFVKTDAADVAHLTKAVGGAGLGGNPYRDGSYEYYIKEPTRDDDLKAIGPFMQACIELDMLSNIPIGKGKNIVVDNYFNNESRNGLPFHYTWEDGFDSGFSWWGYIFRDFGATTSTLKAAPAEENLQSASVYIIVDPDTRKETTNPNFIQSESITVIKDWVTNGGVLVLLANDTANCEIKHFNELTKAFGIEFTNKSRNMVKNDVYEQGRLLIPPKHPIFKNTKTIFIKELVTLSVKKPAKATLKDGKDVIMATANVGKGTVFVLGDPWLYNEYVNGRKLPATYENFDAAKNLAEWLLNQSSKVNP
ncbi:MAG TPA: glycoside hydrolase family 88 protein [Cyclobacteriaceae bacterium]|nr:glycoside hydrolase family 88 protein [Cyclobacteriaceae bacterium]